SSAVKINSTAEATERSAEKSWYTSARNKLNCHCLDYGGNNHIPQRFLHCFALFNPRPTWIAPKSTGPPRLRECGGAFLDLLGNRDRHTIERPPNIFSHKFRSGG